MVTGLPTQLGGVASVVKHLLALKDPARVFDTSATWSDEDATRTRLRARIVDKTNRLLSREPSCHPYRFPQISHLAVHPPAFDDHTILHVHKASLWQQAIRWKHLHPYIALVFHAHSVDGFTGGCVLETDCPMLRQQCTSCPIIKPPARALARAGFRHRAHMLETCNPVVVANSRSIHQAITSSGMIPEGCRVEVITPGVDPDAFFPRTAPERPTQDRLRPLNVGFVSYSIENPNKGFEDFVAATRMLQNDFPVRGHAVGNVRQETRDRFEDIHFIGPVCDAESLRAFYHRMDCLVIASRSESFGLIFLESQFCGTPVFAYAVGGLPETILDGVTGRLVPANSPAALAEALRQIQRHSIPITLTPSATPIRGFLQSFESARIHARWASLYAGLFPGGSGPS